MICYVHDDENEIYPEDAVDQPPSAGYRKVEIPDNITLTCSSMLRIFSI